MNDGSDDYIDWKDWRDESFGKFDARLANYFAAEVRIAAAPGVRVLEIGFGNGAFVGWAQKLGIEIFGVELSPALVQRCRALLGEGRAFADLDDPRLSTLAASFTHIVAFDVIEHISQPALPAFLSRLRSLLAAQGKIVLRFPNGDSPFGRIHQHGDPTHVTTLGRSKIRYFAEQAGLEVECIRAPALPLLGVSLLKAARRTLIAAGRYCVERVLGLLYFGGSVIPLDPNYVAVLVHARGRNPRAQTPEHQTGA